MDYLSKKGFLHRDIAARNILVNENGICKVGLNNTPQIISYNYMKSHTLSSFRMSTLICTFKILQFKCLSPWHGLYTLRHHKSRPLARVSKLCHLSKLLCQCCCICICSLQTLYVCMCRLQILGCLEIY